MTALQVGIEVGSAWTKWSLDPTALIGIPLAAYLYSRGLRNFRGRLRFHATWRPWAFYAGLLVIAVALLTPLDYLSERLFVAHMSQHMLLMMVGVPLVLLGAPMIPILRGIPRPMRRKIVFPVATSLPVRATLRFLTQPLPAWIIYVATLILWHFPLFYVAAIDNAAIHTLEHLIFAAGAYLFWWNVIDPVPLRPNMTYLVRIPYIFITVVPAFALGAFLTFAGEAWYAPYETTAPLYGLSALEDQQLGGVVMWIPGSFIVGGALLIDLYFAVRSEEQRQRRSEGA
jgi:putative membrane protein